MEQKIIKEACVESLSEALEAQRRGADQIELCSNLAEEGLTPSAVLIQECLIQLSIPVKVMVRPRPGSFVCDTLDLGDMVSDIKMMKNLGVHEIALGVTTPDGNIDIESLKLLIAHAGDMRITFHKAIDTCTDPLQEVRHLVELGSIHGVLTSGGASTANEGITNLLAMSEASGGEIQIIAAGSITDKNIDSLHNQLQLSTYHGRRIMGDLNLKK
jgi:copper homeostasis protein